MSIIDILYVILGACIVVITVTIVWLANETIKLVKSLRKSSDDVAFMTQEVKEKVLVVTEALDRAGTAATSIIGFIEDAIEGIKEKRDQLSNSIGLIAGVGDYFKKKTKQEEPEAEVETEKEVAKKELPKEEKKEKKTEKTEEDSEKLGNEPIDQSIKNKKLEIKNSDSEVDDLEHAKPVKKELGIKN